MLVIMFIFLLTNVEYYGALDTCRGWAEHLPCVTSLCPPKSILHTEPLRPRWRRKLSADHIDGYMGELGLNDPGGLMSALQIL